ncbi:MAG: M23 family metallopeptidase [Bacteroidota bacterium]
MYFQINYFTRALLLFIIVSALSLSGYSQGFVIDTTDFFYPDDTTKPGPGGFNYDVGPEEVLIEDEAMEDGPENNFVPGDIIFVPSEVVNSNRWDTLYIRTGRTDFSQLSEPKTILLNNPGEGRFCFPYKGKVISPYGPRGKRFHAGMDIKLEQGDTVRSAFTGKVRIARVMSGYGKMIVIRHTNGLETVYGHLSKLLVTVNQEVRAGEVIGLGGRTGRATTTHLHFETRYLGEHFNPDKIIDFNNFCINRDTLIIDKDFFSKKKSVNALAAAQKNGNGKSGNSGQTVTSKYHTIKSGDTLYAISLRYKTTVSKICKLNGISSKKKLKVGTRLRVK